MLRQPDGSLVPVHVFGDEFYQEVECPQGFTLIRDAEGWITYAGLSADGAEYVSTGVRYMGPQSVAPALQRRVRINRESFSRKHRANKLAVGFDNDEMVPTDMRRGARVPGGISPAPMAVQEMRGLAVLINFPAGRNPHNNAQIAAVTSGVSTAAMEEFFNREGGFRGTNPAGSVRDWFLEASGGTLDYTNIVAPFVTVQHPKNYYDTLSNYQFVPELLQSALTAIKTLAESGQLDLSGLSTEGNNNTVMALNVYYAGSATQGWSNGLWPHQGTYRAPSGQSAVTINIPAQAGRPARTIRFGRYQLSTLGTDTNPPGIGTTVHENGHMIMRWPDLYNYDNTVTNVVGRYCVMSSSNGTNPQMPNPYFRHQAGWIDVVDITNQNGVFAHTANSDMAYQFRRNNQESFFIEARRQTGRSAQIPGEGLIIWHVHTNGVNTRLNAQRPFPQVKVIQANNPASTTVAFPAAPGANAPFRAGAGSRNTSFGRNTSPPALYHDGTPSNLDITEVSTLNTATATPLMSFRVGSGTAGPPVFLLTVADGTGSGLYRADTTIAISAPDTNATGRAFMRWNSGDTATLNRVTDVYARATTIRTRAAEATVSAVYARPFNLPGSVEADTFGLAQGITSVSNTQNGATGNRVARIVDTSRFAEYVVNVRDSGVYQLSYRLLTGTASAGRFRIRDMTNGGVTVDSVTVPTSTRTMMQTLDGSLVTLRRGRAVWRLEPLGGNYSIDWFGAELPPPPPPTTFRLTVNGGSGGGLYESDTEVDIAAAETDSVGRYFLRWHSTTLDPQNVFSSATAVTTIDVDASVTAHFARAFVLPGLVEADTFGFAQGIRSVSESRATGNRMARVADTSLLAEYVVNVSDSGSYRLSYRLLTGTASAGSFLIRDMTNGVILDSVVVPTSDSTAMQTVVGRLVALRPGRVVWRLEPLGGNYGIDWFGAELEAEQVSVRAAARTPLAYGIRVTPSGNVRFSVPNAGHVSLRMYDIRGKLVATLFDGTRSPGVYSVNMSALHGGAGVGQGLYIIRMKSGAYSNSVKVHHRR
jgi:M6 family metalloprotease-like protein